MLHKKAKLVFALILLFSWDSAFGGPFSQNKGSSVAKLNKSATLPTIPQIMPTHPILSRMQDSWNPKPIETNKIFTQGQRKKQLLHQGIYNWIAYQQSSHTGLVKSFGEAKNPMLKDQASTYDQALAGMAFLLMGDFDRAKQILVFYASKWEGKGFYNFYSSLDGRVGLGWRRHLGPNMWLALFIYQYEQFTNDLSYRFIAEGLCDWVISLPHYNGGPAMSDLDESDTHWREIVATEDVIKVVAVFQIAIEKVKDYRRSEWFAKELAKCKKFLRQTAIQKNGSLARGFRPFFGGVDKTPTIDSMSGLIAVTLPQNLQKEYKISLEKMLAYAETHFQSPWGGGLASAYWLASETQSFSPAVRKAYSEKAKRTVNQIDQFVQKKRGRVSYPYTGADSKFIFNDSLQTPQRGLSGEHIGSVSATCWRLFSGLMNPLRLDQPRPHKATSNK